MEKKTKIIAIGALSIAAIAGLWYGFVYKPHHSSGNGAGSGSGDAPSTTTKPSGGTGTVIKPVVKPAQPKGVYLKYDNQKVYGYNSYTNQVLLNNVFTQKKGYYVGMFWKEDASFYITDKSGVHLAVLKANAELK